MSTAATRKIRPPVKRHGGKAYLARRIAALMPPHRVYIEPFLGGGSVLLNKPPAEVEIASDLDDGLIRMWRSLCDSPTALIGFLSMVDYGKAEWETACRHADVTESPVAAPAATIIRSRMSRGGLGLTFGESTRLRGGRNEYENSWETFKAVDLPAICERVRGVRFLNENARWVIEDYDNPDSLFYCDPPYVHASRTARSAYAHEMSDGDHRGLIATLKGSKSKWMLSGYRCDLYDGLLADYPRVEFDMPNHSGQGKAKQRRTECLWMNFEPAEGHS